MTTELVIWVRGDDAGLVIGVGGATKLRIQTAHNVYL
jgi:hypothetical protein